MTLTQQLVEIGMAPASDSISAKATEATRFLLLDALGCILGGYGQPGVDACAELMGDWGGKPEATILATGARVPAPHAAFANSVALHALDYDDVYLPGLLHTTAVLVPVVLATGEMTDTSGRDAMAALTMGLEVAGRLGKVCRPRYRDAGLLPSSLIGGFGAVVAAVRLQGLTTEQATHAMGINYAQAAGNRQALLDMTLAKRTQPALAARSALWAVALATRGITGPPNALEGEAGLFRTYLNGDIPAPEELAGAPDRYEVERVSFKLYPSCGQSHNVQLAAERLHDEENLRGDEIERVEVFGCGPGSLVANPFSLSAHPQVDAQFSAVWAAAHSLLRGRARLGDYRDEAVRADAEVTALSEAITLVPPPDDAPPPPDEPGRFNKTPEGVIIYTRDGRRLVRAEYRPQPPDPSTNTFDAVAEKVRACAEFSGTCDADRAEEIIAEVRGLENQPDLKRLISLMTAR